MPHLQVAVLVPMGDLFAHDLLFLFGEFGEELIAGRLFSSTVRQLVQIDHEFGAIYAVKEFQKVIAQTGRAVGKCVLSGEYLFFNFDWG